MRKRITYKGKKFKYLFDYASYHIYGYLDRRIMVDRWGNVTHEYSYPTLKEAEHERSSL